MSELTVTSEVHIDAPTDIVRAQFADVVHHAATGPHRGVRFDVLSDDERRCHYRQTTRVGPVRLRQEMTLERTAGGPLVNTIDQGQFAGGEIRFDVTPLGNDSSRVVATLRAPLGATRIVAPLLRRQVERALGRALVEDKTDIESGTYRPQ